MCTWLFVWSHGADRVQRACAQSSFVAEQTWNPTISSGFGVMCGETHSPVNM